MKNLLDFRYVTFVMAFVFILGLATVNPALCADKVNINTANKSKLQSLSGIGTVKAERIIDYRQDHSFKGKKEIMDVKGIGEGTYSKIKDNIYVE